MKIGKWEIISTGAIEKLNRRITELIGRPMLSTREVLGTEGMRIPYLPLSLDVLYDTAMYSDIIRNIINSLKIEIFRFGIEVVENFTVKCVNCGAEFDKKLEVCEYCNGEVREPDINQKMVLEKWIKKVNENEQNLIDVLKQIEEDFNVVDDGYLLVLKNYVFNETEVISAEIKEVLRGDPRRIKIIADKTGRPGRDDEGNLLFTCINQLCPQARKQIHKNITSCPSCNFSLYTAYFVVEGKDTKIYYVKGEGYHTSKFNPGLLYGFSPIFSVWQKVATLLNQDRWMLDYYSLGRPPRGLLLIPTPNAESLQKTWKWALDEAEKNPHMIPPIAVETSQKIGDPKFLDFAKALDEMQYIEARNEFRRTIGAVYGVMPLFTGDISTGGLANEGLQITVTTRAIVHGQSIFNERILPFLMKQLGITDYKIELKKPEVRDELAEEQLKAQKIANAVNMKNLGFEVHLNEEEEFEFTESEIPTQPTEISEQPTEIPEEQRFTGEPTHRHPEEGRFEGEPSPVRREIEKDSIRLEVENSEYFVVYDGKKEKFNRYRDAYERLLELTAQRFGKEAVTTSTTGVYSPTHSKRIKKELEEGLIFKQDNQEEFLDFISEALFERKFKEIPKSTSDRIKELMLKSIEERWSLDRLTKEIENFTKTTLTSEERERIVRTETQAIQNKLREWNYKQEDKEKEYKYKWLSIPDARRTIVCKRITERTENGVSLEELKKIIQQEAKKEGFEPREFTPHISCRSTMVRVI